MSEYRQRVVSRLVTAQNNRDPAPLRDQDAVADALVLLRQAAPSPEGAIDLEALAAVFWTFWFRHQGAEDPEAQLNVAVVSGTFGFLCPRVPDVTGFPEVLLADFDPADPSHEARFAHLMSTAYADAVTGGPQEERTAALERAMVWSDTALGYVRDDDPVGFVELALHALELHVTRFRLAADPGALAIAARYGRAVCRRLSALAPGLLDPTAARSAAAPALRTLVDCARLLGSPGLTEVEELVAAAPDGALAPETAEGLRFLRALEAQPVSWPGERDLVVGTAIARAGMAEHDASRVACAVRRLRAALAGTPAGHPAHRDVTTALGQALAALAREHDDEAAGLEAVRLLSSVGALGDEQREMFAMYEELQDLSDSDDPVDRERVGPLLGRFTALVRERTARDGAPAGLDIDLELLDLIAGFEPDDASDERIARYRAALAALPADRPHRHAYVAVLAALTGLRAAALQDGAPARAGLLAAESRELTEEAAASAPPGFPVPELLRQGLFAAALPVAAASAATGDVPDEELRAQVAQLTRMSEVRLTGPDTLDSDIEIMRGLLAEAGDDATRSHLSAALGAALSARSTGRADPAQLEEIVRLLRHARATGSDVLPGIDRILADALTTLSIGTFDAEGAREAAALLASSPNVPAVPVVPNVPGGPATDGDPAAGGHPAAAAEPAPGEPASARTGQEPSETERELLRARTELHNALQNYLFGHEPAQLERARRIARRMQDLAPATPTAPGTPGVPSMPGAPGAPGRDGLPWYDLMGDVYVDLVETVGPGGGPRPDLGDAVVDRCRATFAKCPAGHPMRLMASMTLGRALVQRAHALRTADPERARALLAEAEEVSRVVSEGAPEGSPVDPGALLRTVLDVVGGGRLPEVTDTGARRPAVPSEGPLAAMLAPLQARLEGVADADAWRDPAIPAWMRAHGEIGAAAGALGRAQPRVDLALAHLEAGVEAMAAVTDRGSDQASAEHGLVSFEGDIRAIIELVLARLVGRDVASRLTTRLTALEEAGRALEEGRTPPEPLPLDAMAAVAVTGPDVDRAAELLERGRGLLLARRIEARADTGDLRRAHPGLADEFERLTERLGAGGEGRSDAGTSAAGAAEWARLAGLRASQEIDELLRRIRALPGFEGFLRPPAAEELRALAAAGPVVVLNHGRNFCHALVVTRRSITALPLPAGADEVTDAARRLRDAVDAVNAHGAARPSPLQLVAAAGTVRETLAWTWHTIVRPVLALVGSADPVPPHGDWPRVWWIPTGAFSALPLHAAQCTTPGCALGGCGAALDAVVSSYVPGFQTLAYARVRARVRASADHGGALLVADPEEELPGVAAAAAHAAGLLGARQPLIGAAATREAVLTALRDATWAHFGCHAATDPAEPSGAFLRLPSGERVSVLEICRARPRSAQLAFLAACGTARTAERLTDEAVHITSSFLLAGFPTAVGTLWTIDSTHADQVTRDFYRRATSADGTGPGTGAGTGAGSGSGTGTAHALHDTVRRLRRHIPDRPHIWAAYVHAGA